jgi:hypothetical protein
MKDEIKARTINPSDTESGNLIFSGGTIPITPAMAICVDKKEYDRLKTLDENVKKWLSELKKIKTDLDEQQDDPDCPMSRKIASQIKKLESLYK